jgi:hypothetical protein
MVYSKSKVNINGGRASTYFRPFFIDTALTFTSKTAVFILAYV